MKGPLRCEIKKGKLIISIGTDTLKHAFECKEPSNGEPVKIIDIKQFTKDVCCELNDEDEVGNTMVTRLLDDAMDRAIENGSLGVYYEGDE